LGFGVVTAVLIYPYIFCNVAFLLSISATFAVLCPADMIIKSVSFERFGRFRGFASSVFGILAVAVCATFCTLPVVVHYFGYIALIAPLTNLAVTFAVNASLIFGVVATLLYFTPIIGTLVCIPFYFVARIFASYFIWAVNLIGSSGYGVLNVPKDKNIYCFFISIAFILLVVAFYKFQAYRKERAEDAKRQNT
jgi:hypothetical protein